MKTVIFDQSHNKTVRYTCVVAVRDVEAPLLTDAISFVPSQYDT